MSMDSPFKPNESTAASGYNSSDVPAYGSSPEVQPTGRTSTLSVVGFVLSFLFPLVGLILSIVARKQAKETGDNAGLAKAGIIIGAVFFALNIIAGFVLMGSFMALEPTVTTY